jgi:two-component system, chemotaxis family, CheB/CheR fusion protein
MIRRGDEDQPRLESLIVDRVRDAQRRHPGQDPGQIARRIRADVQHDQHARVEVGGQLADEPGEGVDAARGCTEDDDVLDRQLNSPARDAQADVCRRWRTVAAPHRRGLPGRRGARDREMTERMTDASSDGHLVVVGASAGGIEALSALVAGLPAGFGAPIVVAQHLDPHRPSQLTDILARRSHLPVVTIAEETELKAGTVFVVPANCDVEISDHVVRLVPPGDRPFPAPSVDRLMSTAAAAFGERLIAVVLTGAGSDGADGAQRVKAAGGTVVIQDPEEARFPSMPASLEPTIVDLVAHVDAIGPVLHDLVRGAYRPSGSDDDRLLKRFLASVRDRTGIDFDAYRRPTILRRLQRRMAAVRTETLTDYIAYLGNHPEEYQRLVASFLIKVTDFFRDPELFEHVRRETLPDLIKEARRRDRELRVWCAGSATGQEAYSIAILIADLLGDELASWTVRIFATDLDADAVAFARRGLYRSGALESLPPEMVERHFTRLDGQYEVRKHLRAMTVFGEHDLAIRAPFPRIDLAFCRNVLIYFTPELQERALHLFAFSVREGGFLVLGKAETTTPLPDYFAMTDPRLRIFRRRPGFALPPLPGRGVLPPVGRVRPPHPVERAVVDRDRAREPHRDAEERTAAAALAGLPAGVVLVNDRYRVEVMNPAASRLLGVTGPAIGQDLLQIVDRFPVGGLKAAVDGALAGRTANRTLERQDGSGGDDGPRVLQVAAQPANDGPRRRAVLAVRDATAELARGPESPDDGNGSQPTKGSLAARIESMRRTNRRLSEQNEDLAGANVELRTINEDLLVANEETQAATEEVETLNEELQATNEELETLNEELQATIEELNATNEDMHARTAELQELATNLEEQRRTSERDRARFALLVEALSDAVAVIDRTGESIIENEAFAALFGGDGLRPLEDDGSPLMGGDLRARVARGEEFVLQFAAIDRDGRKRWYEAYGRAVPPAMSIGGGGILVVHDTTDLSLRRLQEEFVAIVAHELRTPLTALRGYLQLLGRRAVADEELRLVPLAAAQAERLARLLEELFDVTRADTGRLDIQPRPASLRKLVEETVEIAQSLTDQEIRVEGFDDRTIVNVDPARIQQVLLNILTNAERHAASSPTVTVQARRLRRWLSIEVEDHGPGMTDEVRESLFSRFHSGNVAGGGLGLGLYISRQIVRGHGGTIEADSVPGEGTTFTIRLPLARPGDSPAE